MAGQGDRRLRTRNSAPSRIQHSPRGCRAARGATAGAGEPHPPLRALLTPQPQGQPPKNTDGTALSSLTRYGSGPKARSTHRKTPASSNHSTFLPRGMTTFPPRATTGLSRPALRAGAQGPEKAGLQAHAAARGGRDAGNGTSGGESRAEGAARPGEKGGGEPGRKRRWSRNFFPGWGWSQLFHFACKLRSQNPARAPNSVTVYSILTNPSDRERTTPVSQVTFPRPFHGRLSTPR